MMNFDPLAPLTDFYTKPGSPETFIQHEEPHMSCPCMGTGWLGLHWLYQRELECTCGGLESRAALPDLEFHEPFCDSVPCPLCPLENP